MVKQRIATKALMVNGDGKLLIVREAPATYDESTTGGSYTFPGGRIEPEEGYLDGLKREIREETGLEVGVGEPVFVEEWFPSIKGEPHHIVAIYFHCRPLGNKVRLSHEHDDYKWVDGQGLGAVKLKGPEPSAIREWLKQLK